MRAVSFHILELFADLFQLGFALDDKSTNRRPVARNLEPGTCLIPRDEGRYFLFRKSSRIMSKRGSDQFKRPEIPMRFEDFSFGSIRIDGTTYEHDVVIDRGQIRKRKHAV